MRVDLLTRTRSGEQTSVRQIVLPIAARETRTAGTIAQASQRAWNVKEMLDAVTLHRDGTDKTARLSIAEPPPHR